MCRRCPGARVVGAAELRDHRLVFAGRSRMWDGAVATVRPGEGAVSGLLYELDADTLGQLDRFEGAPRWYRRVVRTVYTRDGEAVEASLYELASEVPLAEPQPDYVRIIVHGLLALDLPIDPVLEATWTAPTGTLPEHRVFVYGTLLADETNASNLRGAARVGMARTTPDFQLVDLGLYPALLTGGNQSVLGEVYAVDAETLAALDVFEGVPTLYHRDRVALVGGRSVELYIYAQQAPHGRPIVCGDWRWHRRRTTIRAR